MLLAADADVTTGLVQYGAIGIMLIVLIILARQFIVREQVARDKADQALSDLNKLILERYSESLFKATGVMSQAVDVMLKFQAYIDAENRRKDR